MENKDMLQKTRSLTDLENAAEFIARHIGPSADDQQQMLSSLGCNSLEELTSQVVPEAIAMAAAKPRRLPNCVKSPPITKSSAALLVRVITTL
jgi:glycine cleavage system pyridoxal-binding protein P